MDKKLLDPGLAPWAVVEVREDESAVRNDGQELQSRHENPWYILATLEDEQGPEIDGQLTNLNRNLWEQWRHGGFPQITSIFQSRTGGKLELPDSNEPLNFTAIFLPEHVAFDLAQYHLLSEIDFRHATILGPMNFVASQFHQHARFGGTAFGNVADFTDAKFRSRSTFEDTVFAVQSGFSSTCFEDYANFKSTSFFGGTSFKSAKFEGFAEFANADFRGAVSFRSTEFRSITNFRDATFKGGAPALHDCSLYQDTRFTLKSENWPRPKESTAEDDKSAYVRLRQLMNDLHKPDDEHFFFRQEMACDALLKSGWDKWIVQGFGWISDYGYGVKWPAACLLLLWAVPMLLYLGAFGQGCWDVDRIATSACRPVQIEALTDAAGFSFSNLFAFFGLHRVHFAEILRGQSDWIHFLAGFQTVFGFIFLFFLGLGLRNRFRLR